MKTKTLSTRQAANLLGVSLTTLVRISDRGEIQYTTDHNRRRQYTHDDIEAYQRQQRERLSTTELANLLDITYNSARLLSDSGELPCQYDEQGKRWYRREDVEAYLDRKAQVWLSLKAKLQGKA